MDARFVTGGFVELGPAAVWLRMRQPLVDDEPPSPLVRALVAADTGNGVSAELDFHRYLFINTELTVHLTREPEGEWVCLDAVTRTGPQGVGLSESRPRRHARALRPLRPDALRARAMRRSATCFMPPRTVHLPVAAPPARRSRPHATSIRHSAPFCDGRPPPSMTASGG